MSEDFLPKSDSDIVRWAANFVTVATANLTAINFTAGQVNTLQTQNTALNTQLTLVDTKREEYRTAVQSKDAARRIVISTAREYNRLVQSRVSVPNALKVQLGVRRRDQSGFTDQQGQHTRRQNLLSGTRPPPRGLQHVLRPRRDLRQRRHKLPPAQQGGIVRQYPGVENPRQ